LQIKGILVLGTGKQRRASTLRGCSQPKGKICRCPGFKISLVSTQNMGLTWISMRVTFPNPTSVCFKASGKEVETPRRVLRKSRLSTFRVSRPLKSRKVQSNIRIIKEF
jgi:hypothetical protein